MEKFKTLYLWMVIPFILIQVGIFNYYWPKFSDVSWEIHIHFWVVTFWLLLTIIQPYLVVNGKIAQHRTLGIFGFMLAGAFVFTAISLLDIPLKILASNSGKPGPPPAFFYGNIVIEFILAIVFAYAIAKSVLHRKDLKEHSWWLICSVFYMMMPALGRGLIVFWRSVLPPEKFNPMIVFVSSEIIYVILFSIFISKFGKWKHQATIIGFILVIVRFLRIPIGKSEAVQEFIQQVIQW